jgi:hypothetical protein
MSDPSIRDEPTAAGLGIIAAVAIRRREPRLWCRTSLWSDGTGTPHTEMRQIVLANRRDIG